MNKITKQIVGEALVHFAKQNAPVMVQVVDQAAADQGSSAPTEAQVAKVAIQMATQTPLLKSKRVWATALPIVATLGYALLDPSLIAAFVAWLEAHPGAWWGVAAQLVAVILPILSKALDPRPTQ